MTVTEKTWIMQEAVAEVSSMLSELGLEVDTVEIVHLYTQITDKEYWHISVFGQPLRVVISLFNDDTLHYRFKSHDYKHGYKAIHCNVKDLKKCLRRYIKRCS